MRQGLKTVSWYHCPLSPSKHQDQPPSLPAQTADELVRYNPDNGLFDISYAAAWELGRLITLQNKAISLNLFNWKRAHTQTWRAVEQTILHLPIQRKPTNDSSTTLPGAVQQWFDDLRLLKHLPFCYLVPDETMLPVESIRFFQLDTLWIECLLDGAFSLGRIIQMDVDQDTHRIAQGYLKQKNTKSNSTYSGFLVRSELVSGWPHLHIQGYNTTPPENEDQPLPLIRMERLSKNILFCLFAGSISSVDFFQKSERVHFGIHSNGNSTKIRDMKGSPLGVIEIPWRDEALRVINIQKLANSIKQRLNIDTKISSAQFALAMIAGTPRLRLSISPSMTNTYPNLADQPNLKTWWHNRSDKNDYGPVADEYVRQSTHYAIRVSSANLPIHKFDSFTYMSIPRSGVPKSICYQNDGGMWTVHKQDDGAEFAARVKQTMSWTTFAMGNEDVFVYVELLGGKTFNSVDDVIIRPKKIFNENHELKETISEGSYELEKVSDTCLRIKLPTSDCGHRFSIEFEQDLKSYSSGSELIDERELIAPNNNLKLVHEEPRNALLIFVEPIDYFLSKNKNHVPDPREHKIYLIEPGKIDLQAITRLL